MLDLILVSALVVGLTQLIKVTFSLTKRYLPITALILSFILVTAYVILNSINFSWELITQAIVIALSSVGLYSGVKSTIK